MVSHPLGPPGSPSYVEMPTPSLTHTLHHIIAYTGLPQLCLNSNTHAFFKPKIYDIRFNIQSRAMIFASGYRFCPLPQVRLSNVWNPMSTFTWERITMPRWHGTTLPILAVPWCQLSQFLLKDIFGRSHSPAWQQLVLTRSGLAHHPLTQPTTTQV